MTFAVFCAIAVLTGCLFGAAFALTNRLAHRLFDSGPENVRLFAVLGALVLLILFATIVSAEPRYTLITQELRENGDWVVEPTYTPLLTLRPLNALARGTTKGEALRCTAHVADTYIYLTCDGSEFLLTSFSLQE